MILSEYTRKRLNLIIESFGISDEVDIETDKLLELINKYLKTHNEKEYREKFKYNCFGKTITLILKVITTEEGSTTLFPIASWIEPLKRLEIIVSSQNGNINYRDLYDSIKHELEHCYQNIKMGKGFGSQDVYNVMRSNIYSKNIFDRSLATIIYASTKSEQDAMINGLYAQIKRKQTEESIDEIVKDSEAYAWLQNLYKSVVFIKNEKKHPQMIESIKKYTKYNPNYNYSKFRRIANGGVKKLEWKLARLIKNTKQRFIKEYNVRLSPIKVVNENCQNYQYYLI